MAKTYFEYADRQPDSQINWFKVGSDITEKIKKEDDLREKRKAATEEQFRKDTNELSNAPQGNSDLVNQWTLNYASDASEYLLQMNKLLKSGGIKPKDYNISNQNLRDGTATLFTLSKEYQAEYKEKMERAQPGGEGSASESQIMGMIEGFANLKDTKALINPLNGSISVGKMVEGKDGVKVLAEGADNYMTVNQLRNRIKQKIDKYKVNEDLAGEAKLLGDVVNEVVSITGSSTETGFMTKITDKTKRVGLSQEGQQAVDAYLKTENDIIKSKITNPYNTSSILFDWTGGIDPKTNTPYQVVFDDKLAAKSSHYILYSMKGGMLQPDFDTTENGKEQKKTAEGYIRNKLRSMLEQKTELQPFQQPRKDYAPEYVYDRGDKKKEQQNQGNMIGMLYSGTPEQQQSAVNYFMGLPGVTNVTRDDSGISITRNGETKPLPFINEASGNRMSLDEFVRSASSGLLGKETDVDEILKGAISTGSKQFQSGAASASSQRNDPNSMYSNYVSSNILEVPTNETKAVAALSPVLSKLGFTVEEAVPLKDYIVIKNKDGVASSEIQLSDPNAAEAIQSFLLGNVPGKDEVERTMYLSGLAKKGVLQPPAKEGPPKPPAKELKDRISGY